jgi:hypothetical protein
MFIDAIPPQGGLISSAGGVLPYEGRPPTWGMQWKTS